MATQLWPIHPQPLPDELLSSWMIRLARSNGFKVHNFYAQFFGRERQIWNRDIDHFAPPWLIDGLADRTGTPRERIVQMTLRAFESFAFEHFNEIGMTRWILPLGIFHRTRRAYGQQFCPQCMTEATEPYLRRHWRLALTVICTRHSVMLQDRCIACGRPLAPHRSDMSVRGGFPERSSMLRCHVCRACIAAPAEKAMPEDVRMQLEIENILQSGFVMLDTGQPVYSHLYFDGLRMIMRVVPKPQPSLRRIIFEFASIQQRLDLLRSAIQLTADWPHNFLHRCSALPHSYTTVSNNEVDTPYWLKSVLRHHLFTGRAPLSKEEAEAIAATAERIRGSGVRSSSRKLSGRDVAHLLPAQPIVSDDTADMLIASIDQEITISTIGQRYILLRDKVIFLTARCMHLHISNVLALSTDDFQQVSNASFSFWNRVDTSDKAIAMLRWYMQRIRPKLASINTTALFTTCDGKPLRPTALGMRFKRAVTAAQLERGIPGWTQWARIGHSAIRTDSTHQSLDVISAR